jgi:uncharacterized protein
MGWDPRSILRAVLADYALPWNGDHGVGHWARVLEIGERLAAETGANLNVVRLFALLHDSKRVSEFHDPGHGPRAAEFAATLRPGLIALDDDDFARLHRACAGHTHERTHPDITIQTCWDADRLDLLRVGIEPDTEYLNTEFARRTETRAWANERASLQVIPAIVKDEWLIDLRSRSFR